MQLGFGDSDNPSVLGVTSPENLFIGKMGTVRSRGNVAVPGKTSDRGEMCCSGDQLQRSRD